MSRSAQAPSKEWQRKSTFSARIALISSGVQVLPDGSVKWVPLSVSTVWIEHRVDLVGNGSGKGPQEVAGNPAGGLLVQLSEGKLGSSVDRHEEVELAFASVHLGDVDVEVADRVALELRAQWLVTIDLGQPRDAMALEAAV